MWYANVVPWNETIIDSGGRDAASHLHMPDSRDSSFSKLYAHRSRYDSLISSLVSMLAFLAPTPRYQLRHPSPSESDPLTSSLAAGCLQLAQHSPSNSLLLTAASILYALRTERRPEHNHRRGVDLPTAMPEAKRERNLDAAKRAGGCAAIWKKERKGESACVIGEGTDKDETYGVAV